MSESKKRKGKEKEKKVAFTLVPASVTCVMSLNLHSNPSRWLFLSSLFFVDTKTEVQKGYGTIPSSLSYSVTESLARVSLSTASRCLPRPREIPHPPRRQRAAFNTEAGPELAATRPSINVFFNNEVFSAS